MKRLLFSMAGVVVLMGVVICESDGGRRGGGGGGRGGAIGGGAAGRSISPAAGGGFSGTSSRTRTTTPIVGAGGGAGTAGKGSGSITTKGGTTIDYAGAGYKGTTGGGTTIGRGVGGVEVTTPGGGSYTKVGKAGGAVGPGGVAVGGKSSVGVGTGAGGGKVVTGSRSGAAIGPGGAAAYRGGVAIGPYGAAGTRAGIATGPGGTRYVSRTTLATQGGYVRTGFTHYSTFTPAWYARYPGAWVAAGWTAARIWTAATYGAVSSYCGYPEEPVYYDYGSTVVYDGDTVVVNGENAGSAEAYAKEATTLADAGREAKIADKDDFQALGVFAMVQGEEKTSYKIFQLAVNKAGVIRGNYYDVLGDNTLPVYGSVDPKTSRAAWSIGEKKTVTYEAGIANLTKEETTILAHFADGGSQQFTLVRVERPEDKK
jgi:hypothetical protein